MKGYLKALILILFCLAILIPFASDFPDGLEKVAETLGVEENDQPWIGLMPDYKLPTIEIPYISTLIAGIFGVCLVFCVAFLFGVAINKTRKRDI